MTERRNLEWLYNSPRTGVVAQWVQRHASELQTFPVMDESVLLVNAWEEMGPKNFGYRPDQVTMSKEGQENLLVPERSSELWRIREAHALEQQALAADPNRSRELDANGPKLHLREFTAWLTDRRLVHFKMWHSDWWNVRTLNMGLRDRNVPEHYREDILPTLERDHYIFKSAHPNFVVVHAVVVTSDGHLILTKRVSKSDFHGDAISASIEEQMNGRLDNSPYDTFYRSVDSSPKMKLSGRGGEELRLHIKADRIGLAGVILEPDVNGTGLIIIGESGETSEEIDARILGRDKAEFDPTRPVWTLPLKNPDMAIQQLLDPPFKWHGSSRFRLLTALFAVHGYDEIIQRVNSA
ncbi:hypothetical protein HYT74_01135 [Candidatus Daviesbacteria bacterium]|nr:hypothetical protein [Candidatus Daviesbacteria bacterium]MBI2334526.1 hypothetical protein [Candidatus Daviesbacteria bacterium]MBI3109922.1 hypothetical protein [Candidatus Daviesbacteria bacterium]